MKKYLIILMILASFCLGQQVKDLYTLPIQTTILSNNGTNYLALNLYNAQILESKLKMFNAMYLPVESSLYSNMIMDMQYLEKSLRVADRRLQSKNTEVFAWKIISLACAGGLLFVIASR